MICFKKPNNLLFCTGNERTERTNETTNTRRTYIMKGLTTTTLLLVTVLATNCAAQCTIPSNAVGPVNGGLGSCTQGKVLSVYGNCEYCKCLYLFATSSVLLRCFTLTRSFLMLLSSIYQKQLATTNGLSLLILHKPSARVLVSR